MTTVIDTSYSMTDNNNYVNISNPIYFIINRCGESNEGYLCNSLGYSLDDIAKIKSKDSLECDMRTKTLEIARTHIGFGYDYYLLK